ncbi:hypothetical protein V1498_10190 [Peribacillus sp. SCS-26]|uniref:hypothetical protein n=1 Tax=Paraperibacillus marinus TaxID=3115295 RepID=UPI0039060228
MNMYQIRKLLKDLAVSPYRESDVSHTLSRHNEKLEISFSDNISSYEIRMPHQKATQYFPDVDSAADAISAFIHNEISV